LSLLAFQPTTSFLNIHNRAVVYIATRREVRRLNIRLTNLVEKKFAYKG